MSSPHEVISALLDDQRFDRQELAEALDDPAGRALLIDLAMLRRIVQPTDAWPALSVAKPVRRRPWLLSAAAAVLLLGLGGGYVAGQRRAVASSSQAPPPTRVVEAVPFVPVGGMR